MPNDTINPTLKKKPRPEPLAKRQIMCLECEAKPATIPNNIPPIFCSTSCGLTYACKRVDKEWCDQHGVWEDEKCGGDA